LKINKLLIMSVDKNYTVGYTENGQFVKIPRKPAHKVGQIINYQPTKPSSRKPWGVAIAAAILLVFFTGIFNPFFQEEAAAAYLSIGLNTGSLAIWTDDSNKVIKTQYTDSLKMLNQSDLNGKDIYEAVSLLVLTAKENGLITENENDIVLIDLIDLTENKNHHIAENKLKKVILEGLNIEEYQGLMMMGRHDKEYLTKATELNLTASQYHIYETSRDKGHNLETEKIQHGHIRSVLKEAGTTPEEIFDMNYDKMHDNNEMTSSDFNNNIVVPEDAQENMMNNNTKNNSHEYMQMNSENRMHN